MAEGWQSFVADWLVGIVDAMWGGAVLHHGLWKSREDCHCNGMCLTIRQCDMEDSHTEYPIKPCLQKRSFTVELWFRMGRSQKHDFFLGQYEGPKSCGSH